MPGLLLSRFVLIRMNPTATPTAARAIPMKTNRTRTGPLNIRLASSGRLRRIPLIRSPSLKKSLDRNGLPAPGPADEEHRASLPGSVLVLRFLRKQHHARHPLPVFKACRLGENCADFRLCLCGQPERDDNDGHRVDWFVGKSVRAATRAGSLISWRVCVSAQPLCNQPESVSLFDPRQKNSRSQNLVSCSSSGSGSSSSGSNTRRMRRVVRPEAQGSLTA